MHTLLNLTKQKKKIKRMIKPLKSIGTKYVRTSDCMLSLLVRQVNEVVTKRNYTSGGITCLKGGKIEWQREQAWEGRNGKLSQMISVDRTMG